MHALALSNIYIVITLIILNRVYATILDPLASMYPEATLSSWTRTDY